MAKGIKKKLKLVREKVQQEINSFARRGHLAAGLAGEGYNGGYRDALCPTKETGLVG